jgi:chaperonin cofactor prefoldin
MAEPSVEEQLVTLKDLALRLKDAGNGKLKENKRQEALDMYSQGIEAARVLPGSDGKSLLSVLLSNRAHVKMLMGSDVRSTLTDCTDAIAADASNLKAFYRAAKCCVVLNDLPAAQRHLQKALALDASNEAVRTLQEEVSSLTRTFSPEEIETIRNAYFRTSESAMQLHAQIQQLEVEKMKLNKTLDVLQTVATPTRTFTAVGKAYLRREQSEICSVLSGNMSALEKRISDQRASMASLTQRLKKAEVDWNDVQKFLLRTNNRS